MQPDLNKLMRQAQQMQAQVAKAQEELATAEFEGTAGGGAVTAKVTGDGKLVSVVFNEPSVLDPDDPELVGDVVVAAVNQALAAAQEAAAAAMSGAAGLDLGGLDLGGLLGG